MVVTGDHSAVLNAYVEILKARGRLEHASPDVDADEVREAIERLRKALPDLIESTHDWLRRHGVEFR